jgi:hypothetical protein
MFKTCLYKKADKMLFLENTPLLQKYVSLRILIDANLTKIYAQGAEAYLKKFIEVTKEVGDLLEKPKQRSNNLKNLQKEALKNLFSAIADLHHCKSKLRIIMRTRKYPKNSPFIVATKTFISEVEKAFVHKTKPS